MKFLDIDHRYRTAVAWHSFAWMLLGIFTSAIIQQVGFIVKKTGGSPALVAFVMTGPYAVSIFAMLYVPYLEHFRARTLVSVSKALSSVVFLAAAFCTGPVTLALVAISATVVYKLGDTFYGRLLGQLYPQKVRGRMLSLPMFTQAAVAVGISVIAGWALKSSEQAYRWFLPLASLAGIAAAAVILKLPVGNEESAPERERFVSILREVARDRSFLIWMLVYSVTTIGYWLVYSAKPVFFESILHFGYWENGIAQAALNATYCLGFLLLGRLLDRVRSVMMMVLGWALAGAGALIMVAGRSFEMVLVGQILSGFGLASNDIAWYTVVLEFAPQKHVDRYMGFYMTVFGIRIIIAGFLSGTLMEVMATGSQTVLLVGGFVSLAGTVGIYLFNRFYTWRRNVS